MASPVRLISRFRFGAFELDAASGELRKSGIPIKLQLQAIQVLLMLAERAGHIVPVRKSVSVSGAITPS